MTLHNDLVSVVIPVYNSGKFLAQSIESVLNQTYNNIEIICVDDGSTDNSSSILRTFSDEIKVISKKQGGLSSALNTGIKEITGKWLKWFSPDDILEPDTIETLVNESKKLPDNTIVYSDWQLIDEYGKKIRIFSESNYNNLEKFDFNIRLLDGQQININTTLIPKKLIDKGCNIRNLKDQIAIDYDFFLRAALLYETKFHLISKALVKYRIHSKQLSHRDIVKSLSYITKLRNEILSQLDKSLYTKYENGLKKFQQNKPLRKKTLGFGLKIMSKYFPNWVTDPILVFYVNKIRITRQ